MNHPTVTDFVERLDEGLREAFEERAAILETIRTGSSGIGRGERILRV